MKTISGNYQKGEKIHDFSFPLPDCWEELSPSQTAAILHTLSFKKADEYTIKVSVMVLMAGHQNFYTISCLTEDDLYCLVELCNWIFTTRPPVKNSFPQLKLRRKIYHAPNDDLSNLCFGEWCFAYEFYKLYHATNNLEYLNKLIATLYRLPNDIAKDDVNYNGDSRLPFNENLIEYIAKSVSDIDYGRKIAVLTWFTSALLPFMDARPHVFPKTEETQVEDNDEAILDNRTWLTVFRELLGPKFGTAEQLKYTNAMFVLDFLEEQHIAYEEAKSKLPK